MAPKVLVSDKLSETAVQIFRDRGIDVDFQPDLGKDKEKLAAVIGTICSLFYSEVGADPDDTYGILSFTPGEPHGT